MICTMVHFIKSISLDIWRINKMVGLLKLLSHKGQKQTCRIKRHVCFWPLWLSNFSKPTISFTVVTFFSVRVGLCFSLPVSCLWSVLHVSKIFVNNIPALSLLQFISKNFASILRKLYFLNGYKFLIKALYPL